MIENLFSSLLNRSGVIMILAFLLTKLPLYRKLVLKNKITLREKFLMAILFAIIGIIGTYYGIPVNGAIANSRVIGVFVGGWLGGPLVGFLSGLLAGGHRLLTDIGGFTALACSISTLVEGIIGGYGSKLIKNSKINWLGALILGALAEIIQMIIILAIARPYEMALELVRIIWLPMVVVNAIGISIFIALTQNIFVEQERIGARQSQLALNIANKTLPYLRRGLNHESVKQTALIIYEMTDLDAVAITDTTNLLAHVGIGSEYYIPGREITSPVTKEVINTGEYKISSSKSDIECMDSKCKLRSALTVPLIEGNSVEGTLRLFRINKDINTTDIKLAVGLAQLFSTQLELSKIEHQKQLLAKTELKMLQAQINPHFLFNALNTIVSFVRTKPDRARELILNLADYFRQSLQFNNEDVELKREIENIESYLAIERARFGDKLKVTYSINVDLHSKIPPLILQPIVENAVKHGIFEKEKGGSVTIEALNIGDDIELIVKDDGIGIEEELMNKLMNDLNNCHGIGLSNVHRRLICKYGKDYGLHIQSERGKGTTVIVRIPRVQKEDMELCDVL